MNDLNRSISINNDGFSSIIIDLKEREEEVET
jgi:hypothetical protein